MPPTDIFSSIKNKIQQHTKEKGSRENIGERIQQPQERNRVVASEVRLT